MNNFDRPLINFSDDEVLAIAKSKITPEEQDELENLLYWNATNQLTKTEKQYLAELNEKYDELNLRKADGMAEAKLRGLEWREK